MPHAVIIDTLRSPIGRAYKGALAEVRPDDLLALVFKGLLARIPGLDPGEIEDIIVGCGQPAGEQGYNIARVAGILAGLPETPATTVNRYCGSSIQAMRMAFHAIRAQEGSIFLCGGVECVSRFGKGRADGMEGTRNPRFAEAMARSDARAHGEGEVGGWSPPQGLPDVYIPMGQTAENVAELCEVSRSAMDAFAHHSQARTEAAVASGFFDREILPIPLPGGGVLAKDESPRSGTTLEALAGLKPVFRPDGRVTAGNACPLNDGAAACVIMSDTRAKALGLTPRARILGTAVSGLDPEIMGLGPIEASRRLLDRLGISMAEIDLVEINEAFAAQVIPCARALGVDFAKLNVHGGAIALGHPFGMTGIRIMGTLLNGLEATGGRLGLETLCTAGGQGMAVLVERLG